MRTLELRPPGWDNSDSMVEIGRGDDAGVGATVLVYSDSGADAERSDGVAGIGVVGSVDLGTVVDAFGQASGAEEPDNDGVGDGLRSHTYNPNDGARPGSYISGQNNNERLSDEASDSDGNWDARQLPRAVRYPQAVSGSTTGQVDQHRGEHGDASDGEAIAGYPMSSTRPGDRPQRATKRPVRYKDFEML